MDGEHTHLPNTLLGTDPACTTPKFKAEKLNRRSEPDPQTNCIDVIYYVHVVTYVTYAYSPLGT